MLYGGCLEKSTPINGIISVIPTKNSIKGGTVTRLAGTWSVWIGVVTQYLAYVRSYDLLYDRIYHFKAKLKLYPYDTHG